VGSRAILVALAFIQVALMCPYYSPIMKDKVGTEAGTSSTQGAKTVVNHLIIEFF